MPKSICLKTRREFNGAFMKNIITITPNPAYDVHCNVPKFSLYHENFAEITSTDAGGKGINISRALSANGIYNRAFTFVGDENGDGFGKAFEREEFELVSFTVNGRVRENITCHTEGAPETRISFSGFTVTEEDIYRMYEFVKTCINKDTTLALAGSFPRGFTMEHAKILLGEFTKRGARIVIDSRSFSLDDLRELRPWLIKPNQEEISAYFGREIKSFDEIVEAAEALHLDGIENVMISLGGDGAMLVCKDGVFTATPPKISVISTIGAGDSSIAGFLASEQSGASPLNCLRTAVAYGSAACLTEGTKPPRKEDIEAIYPLIACKKLK